MAAINLYKHQREALDHMKNGCILCGGVGSGKSRTALAYYYTENEGLLDEENYEPMTDPPVDLYIITTARKRDTLEWEEELHPFAMSSYSDLNYYANQIVIDSWNNIGKYAGVKEAFFIFDEDRVVGNGVWVKNFLTISRHNRWILLSATPGDTWMDYIPVFIANGFYRTRTEFLREHVVYSRFSKYPKVDRYLNVKKLIAFRDNILVDMDFDRPTTSHHEDIFVPYDRDLYRFVMRNRWDVYKNEPIQNAGGLCYILRRVVNSDLSRILEVERIAREKNRVIVFYNFDYELAILQNLDLGPEFEIAEWNGHKHNAVPTCKKWVYLVQYTAGAEGWNCVETDTIIFYSQSHSYKAMKQASGRIDRLNTPFYDLYYYHLKSKSPIDLRIASALREKKNFNARKFVKW